MHGLQPLQGFEVQLFMAHQQVTAFHQRQSQIARQVGVFKISFVVRAGCEQHDAGAGMAVSHRAEGFHAVDQARVRLCQACDVHAAKSLWKQHGNAQAVFKQVAQA